MPVSDVIIFSFDYPPNDGGIARLCAAVASGLGETGTVDVLSHRCSPAASQSAIPTNVRETRVTRRRPIRELMAWWHLVRRHAGQPVIAGTWYPEGLIALLAGHRQVVILAHGAELTQPLQRWRRRPWAWLRTRVLARASLVVANSRYTAGLVREDAPSAHAVAIPLAADHTRFTPGDRDTAQARIGVEPDRVVITTVTRLQAFKGIDVVLRAIAAMPAAARERITYLVGGQGSALGPLQALARELGISPQVKWLGFVPEADLPDLYRAANLFALCTRERLDQRAVEGFGMVFLEAQACGTPVVGTRTGGIPDAIREGEGGWLIAQDDIATLRDILCDLVEHPELFDEAGRAGRRRVEREGTWTLYLTRFRKALAAVEEP